MSTASMTREQARRILDQVRAGEADYSITTITRALIETGDLKAHQHAPVARLGRSDGWQPGARYAQVHRGH